jgi:AraC-like DNA-binding protein
MSTLIIPNAFVDKSNVSDRQVSCCLYETSELNVTHQIKLTKNVISIIIEGTKKLIKDQSVVSVEKGECVCIQSGHCIMQERSSDSDKYRSLLLFFDDNTLEEVLQEYRVELAQTTLTEPVRQVTFSSNAYINAFVEKCLNGSIPENDPEIISVIKNILLSIYHDNKESVLPFFTTVLKKNRELRFKQFVEKHTYSNLNLDEMAFLCGMSLSTFKRRFKLKYGTTPGKWFQLKRLERAKEMIEIQGVKASDIYADFGYENLSNFSAALKNTLGIGPRQIKAARKKIFA